LIHYRELSLCFLIISYRLLITVKKLKQTPFTSFFKLVLIALRLNRLRNMW
jgi:hypothetical protein